MAVNKKLKEFYTKFWEAPELFAANTIERIQKLILIRKRVKNIPKLTKQQKKQVREYLKKQGFNEQSVNIALNKLLDYGYLNDQYFAESSAKSLSKQKGKNFIKNSLKQKGVSDEEINVAMQSISEQSELETCLEVTRKWLKGKAIPLDISSKQKLYRFLIARGFSFDTIKASMSNCSVEDNDDWY